MLFGKCSQQQPTVDFKTAAPQGPSPTRTKVNKQVTLLSVPPDKDAYLSWLISLPQSPELVPPTPLPPPPFRAAPVTPMSGPATDKVGRAALRWVFRVLSKDNSVCCPVWPRLGVQGQRARPPPPLTG